MTMKPWLLALPLTIASAALPFSEIRAGVLFADITAPGHVANDPNPYTVGWKFNVLNTVTVGGLGFWDQGSDGLAVSHLVRLWTDAGVLLASTTIDNTSTPVASVIAAGRWLFNDIVALVLTPGSYVVGADGGYSVDATQDSVTPSTISDIAYVEGRYVTPTGSLR